MREAGFSRRNNSNNANEASCAPETPMPHRSMVRCYICGKTPTRRRVIANLKPLPNGLKEVLNTRYEHVCAHCKDKPTLRTVGKKQNVGGYIYRDGKKHPL